MLKDTSPTTSFNAINPCGALLNKFIIENTSSPLIISGKNHVAIKNPIESTPAIIWFSVKLDANIPNDIYAKLSKKNPPRVVNAVPKCGVPK